MAGTSRGRRFRVERVTARATVLGAGAEVAVARPDPATPGPDLVLERVLAAPWRWR